MYNSYKTWRSESISQSSFYILVSVLTKGSMEAHTAVDYVAGVLANDNFETLNRIIEAGFFRPVTCDMNY